MMAKAKSPQRPKLDTPRIHPDQLILTTWPRSLDPDELSAKVLVEDLDLASLDAGSHRIERSMLRNVKLNQARFDKADISDTMIENCDLSGADCGDAIFHRVLFANCNLIGTDFRQATFRHVTFQGCAADFSFFRQADFRQVYFQECRLNQADFSASKLAQPIWFERCSLQQAQFSGCKLAGIDWRSNDIEGVAATSEDLRGLIVDSLQAVILASRLGLIVED